MNFFLFTNKQICACGFLNSVHVYLWCYIFHNTIFVYILNILNYNGVAVQAN